MLLDLANEWPIVLMAAVLVAVAMAFAYRLMSRDPEVKRTRYGFFVERERFVEADASPDPGDAPTREWPRSSE